jgi:hypothetical protein
MQLKRIFKNKMLVIILLAASSAWSAEESKQASGPEEFIIVKYGSLQVKSPGAEGRIYIDGVYIGNTDDVIEEVIAGEHLISCQAEEKSVSGTFQVKKGETLRLQALFDEAKLVLYRAPVKEVKTEIEKKKPEPVKQQKPKKVAEAKKAEPRKNAIEERRKAHLTVMKIDYKVTDSQQIRLDKTSNEQVISKYSASKKTDGKYYRTKQGLLVCDTGPCEITWSAKFLYTDETSGTDALLLKWKETVFNGITPMGTSRQDLECCLNGECWRMQDTGPTDKMQELEIGRYRLFWKNGSVVLRRTDIMKEVLEAGRSLSDY